MGYTHYWDDVPTVTPNQWNEFAEKVETLLEKTRIPHYLKVINPFGDSPEVSFSDLKEYPQRFVLNYHEGSSWCKTNRHAYDSLVVAVLALAHHELGLNILDSDGCYSDWQNGVRVLNRALGTNYKPPQNLREK